MKTVGRVERVRSGGEIVEVVETVEIVEIVEIVEGWCRSALPKPLSHLPSPSPSQTSYYTKNLFLCQVYNVQKSEHYRPLSPAFRRKFISFSSSDQLFITLGTSR